MNCKTSLRIISLIAVLAASSPATAQSLHTVRCSDAGFSNSGTCQPNTRYFLNISYVSVNSAWFTGSCNSCRYGEEYQHECALCANVFFDVAVRMLDGWEYELTFSLCCRGPLCCPLTP